MPFSSDSFDVVVFSWVLGYSTNQKQAVMEAVRVLKNGGYICIGEQWDPTPIEVISKQMIKERGYSLEGTVTSSCDQLHALVGDNLKKVLFQTEPIDAEKSKIGWITMLATIQK